MLSFFGLIFIVQSAFAFQVFLDPGHGGHDQGTSRGKVTEASITLKVVKKIGADLSADPDIHVAYSRTSDVYRSLEQRVRMADRTHPNLFLSVHVNSSSDSAAGGQEIYFQNVLDPDEESLFLANLENRSTNDQSGAPDPTIGSATPAAPVVKNPDVNAILADLERNRDIRLSAVFAQQLHKNWTGDSVLRRRFIRQAPFYVISNVNAPAALIEIGYLTNPTEARLLMSPSYQEKMARGIARAIIKFKELVDKPIQPSLN